MIYWGLMKRNDWSVQETEHYLQHYYLQSRASSKQVLSDGLFLVQFKISFATASQIRDYIIKAPNNDVQHGLNV